MIKRTTYILSAFTVFLIACTDDETNEISAEERCPRNVDIGLLGIEPTAVEIKWVETQGFASNYEYGEKGFELGTGTKGSTNDESVRIEGLLPETDYDFYLQSVCTAEVTGQFTTNPYSYTTLKCFDATPDDITAGGLSDNGFQVSWMTSAGVEEWQVAMLEDDGTIPSEDNLAEMATNVTENNHIFSEIAPDRTYRFYIRGKCNGAYGEWVTKALNSGTCYQLAPENIRLVGYVKEGGFEIEWQLSGGSSEEWQVAVVEDNGTPPTEEGLESVTIGFERSYVFDDIDPNLDYHFYLRGKCNGAFGNWIVKDLDPESEEVGFPCEHPGHQTAVGGDDFIVYFDYGDFYSFEVEVLEEGTDFGTGLLYTPESPEFSGSGIIFSLRFKTYFNDNSHYIKAGTQYDVFAHVECGPAFSEWEYLGGFKSPLANLVYFASGTENNGHLRLEWLLDHGLHNNFLAHYHNVSFEIEYGLAGFPEDTGTLVAVPGDQVGRVAFYDLPLNLLESGATYEFSIRSVINGNSSGRWNSVDRVGGGERFVFTVP